MENHILARILMSFVELLPGKSKPKRFSCCEALEVWAFLKQIHFAKTMASRVGLNLSKLNITSCEL